MARFDVYRTRSGEEILLDCQADILNHLRTRFVVPLMRDGAPRELPRLNPAVEIGGERWIMATQLAAAVDARELNERVGNLADYQGEIMNALDMLLTGI